MAVTRATVILASSLAAAAVAGALVYGLHSRRTPDAAPAEPAPSVVEQPHRLPRADTELDPSNSTPSETTIARDEQSPSLRVDERARRRPLPDEATVRADMRKDATRSVRDSYSLLLEDLDLPARDQEDLVALLIEMQIEGMWSATRTGEIRGRKIPEQERHDRIAAAIGDEKLQEFIALEQNLGAYWETQQIASLLRRHDAPLSEAQRDGVFDILLEVHERYPITRPADLDGHSLEHLERVLTQIDDVDRHVVELAPSVLSPTQVVHLFDAYQDMAYERTNQLERQKKRRADRPDERLPWFYPARWQQW